MPRSTCNTTVLIVMTSPGRMIVRQADDGIKPRAKPWLAAQPRVKGEPWVSKAQNPRAPERGDGKRGFKHEHARKKLSSCIIPPPPLGVRSLYESPVPGLASLTLGFIPPSPSGIPCTSRSPCFSQTVATTLLIARPMKRGTGKPVPQLRLPGNPSDGESFSAHPPPLRGGT